MAAGTCGKFKTLFDDHFKLKQCQDYANSFLKGAQVGGRTWVVGSSPASIYLSTGVAQHQLSVAWLVANREGKVKSERESSC